METKEKLSWTFKLKMESLSDMEDCVDVLEKATHALRVKYETSYDEKFRDLYEELITFDSKDEKGMLKLVNSYCKEHKQEYQMVMFKLGMGRIKFDYWDWFNSQKYVERLQDAYDRVNYGTDY
jgi:hypothetical protein